MQTKKYKYNKNHQIVDPKIELDLVCGMELNTSDVKFNAEYKGKTYYFCAIHCKNHFVTDPVKYVGE